MGFRNPLTTAEGVDTRNQTSQRVIIDEAGGSQGGGAVLLHPKGISTGPGLLEATWSPPEAGFWGTQDVRLESPASLVDGPRASLTLRTRNDETGTTGADLNTGGGGLEVDGHAFARQRSYQQMRSELQPAVSQNFGAGGWAAIFDRTLTAAPAGDYFITVTMVLSAAAATAARCQLQINTVDKLQLVGVDYARCDLTTQPQPTTFTYGLENYAGGDLRITPFVNPATSTGTVWTAGTSLSILYLGPRNP